MLGILLAIIGGLLFAVFFISTTHDPELTGSVGAETLYSIREVCSFPEGAVLFQQKTPQLVFEILLLLVLMGAVAAALVFLCYLAFRYVERTSAMRQEKISSRPLYVCSGLVVIVVMYWFSHIITRTNQYRLDFINQRFEHTTSNLYEEKIERNPLAALSFTMGSARGAKGGARYTISIQRDGVTMRELFESSQKEKVSALLEYIHQQKK
jgi:H+/Cl- antiporter ClcA